jgi:lipoprotein-releasing system permease protein
MIFTFEGLLIGCGGALIGLFPGVLIAFNIGPFFTFLETVVNGVLKGLAWGISLFTAHPIEMGTFGIFSPQIFYLKTVPSRLLPLDILLILLFPIVVSTLAAFLASRKITTLRPAEVLRYE